MVFFYTYIYKWDNIINIFIILSKLKPVKDIIYNAIVIFIVFYKYILVFKELISFAYIVLLWLEINIIYCTIWNAFLINFLAFIY